MRIESIKLIVRAAPQHSKSASADASNTAKAGAAQLCSAVAACLNDGAIEVRFHPCDDAAPTYLPLHSKPKQNERLCAWASGACRQSAPLIRVVTQVREAAMSAVAALVSVHGRDAVIGGIKLDPQRLKKLNAMLDRAGAGSGANAQFR